MEEGRRAWREARREVTQHRPVLKNRTLQVKQHICSTVNLHDRYSQIIFTVCRGGERITEHGVVLERGLLYLQLTSCFLWCLSMY